MSSELLSQIASLPNLFLAWKKAKRHIMRHNWYFDALDVELFELDIEHRLTEISRSLIGGSYSPSTAYLVPAPKKVETDSDGNKEFSDRNLAYCSLRDEVFWIAVLNKIADRFEDAFVHSDPESQNNLSYGNRLYREVVGGRLRFSDQNNKLYREFYRDYSNFLKRSLQEAEKLRQERAITLYQLDIKSFYDRIPIDRLCASFRDRIEEEDVYLLIKRWLSEWRLEDPQGDNTRTSPCGIPQGLSASGFISNVYLSTLDIWARDKIRGGSELLYYARYVDDIRLVIHRKRTVPGMPGILSELQAFVKDEMGLQFNDDKLEKIPADKRSAPFRQDQLAIRVSQVDWECSHLIAMEDARSVSSELETLLYLEIGAVAMRTDTRIRFATNRLVQCWKEFREIDQDYWDAKIKRLNEWLFHRWKSEPSLVSLMNHYIETTRGSPVRKVIKRVLSVINGPSSQLPQTWQWYLRSALYRYLCEIVSRAGRKTTVSILARTFTGH